MNEDLELRMIREIEKREAGIEKREEELLENVMTLEEYFDEEFLKSTKFVEVGDKKLYRYFVDDIPLHEYPVCGVLKNNIDIANVKEELMGIVKTVSSKDYNTLVKYKDNITIKFKYQSVFLLDIKCDGIVNTVVAKYISKHRGFSVTPYNGSISRVANLVIDMPKGKLDVENIKKSNFNQILPTDILPAKTSKTMCDLYRKVKREIIKYMKNETKLVFKGKNYCLRGIDFDNIELRQVLVPVYLLRSSDPGFDTKYTINANSRIVCK